MRRTAQRLETSQGAPVQAARAVPLLGFYVLYFSTTGILLPFLPAFFNSAGLDGSQIGILLALQPTFTLVVPPLWGWVVDRFGRPDRALTVIAFGAALGFAPVAFADGFSGFFVGMALYAFFVSSVTTVLDSIALQRVAAVGGSYARIRLFGSIGFVVASTLFGLAVDEIDRTVVFVPLALIASYAVWSLFLQARSAQVPPRHPLAGLKLLRHRDLALMLIASALHWIACAPFHATFGIHVTAIGLPPWVIGAAAGIGVAAEVMVMFLYPRLTERIPPRYVLFAAFVISAVRWFGMSVLTNAWAIIALSVLHGFTFGAYYVASVSFVARRVPDAMRASGQALLVSVTFGLGALVGYVTAGAGYEWLGGFKLFAVAGVLQLVPAFLILGVRDANTTRAQIEATLPSA